MKRIVIVLALVSMLAGCASDGISVRYESSNGARIDERSAIEDSVIESLRSND